MSRWVWIIAAFSLALMVRPAAAESARRIAVLELWGPADGPMLRMLTDDVRGGVLQAAGSEDYVVMSRENIVMIARAMDLDLSCLEGECEVDTGRLLGAAYVVSGEVVRAGTSWFCVLKIHSTDTGALLATDRIRASSADGLLGGTRALASQLTARTLGTHATPAPAPAPREAEPPVTAIAPPPPPPAGQLSVDQRLREQGCTRTAETRGKAARTAKLTEAVNTARTQARQSWTERTQSGELERCTKLPRAERTSCISSVEQWLPWARALSVTLPAGEERVQTDCGDRVVAYPEERRVVAVAEISKAEALLKRLKAADAVVPATVRVPVPRAEPTSARTRYRGGGQPLIELVTGGQIVGDGSTPVLLHVVAFNGDASPVQDAALSLFVNRTKIGSLQKVRDGLFAVEWVPQQTQMPMTTEIALRGKIWRTRVDKAWQVALVPAEVRNVPFPGLAKLPYSVQLVAEPTMLSRNALGFQVLVKVLDESGVGMAGQALGFVVNGARQDGHVYDLGSGDYQARFKTTGKGAVEIVASVARVGMDNPVARVLILPSRDRLPQDGLSTALLTIVTLDANGYPVGNVPLRLKLSRGKGVLPAQTITNNAGLAQVHFTAGRTPGIAIIDAYCSDLKGDRATIPLLLAPSTLRGQPVAVGYALPNSGSPGRRLAFENW